ncbi:MAG TPA: hypothetical protein VGU45_08350 [Microvirga sp.]|jgi:hypothetical protein|nr:hypothetical protein [Microvirga sp.]
MVFAQHDLNPYEVSARRAPEGADAFARAVILTICSAAVTESVGRRTFERCMRALESGGTARMGFRHPSKAAAIDQIWRERHGYHRAFQASANRRAQLEQLPGIGPATARALAARLGLHDAADGRRAA